MNTINAKISSVNIKSNLEENSNNLARGRGGGGARVVRLVGRFQTG